MAEVVKEPEQDIEWHEVESSNIHSVRYEKDSKKLYVQFSSGSTYSYDKVPIEVYTGLIHADSVGKYLNQHIKPYHAYELVTL